MTEFIPANIKVNGNNCAGCLRCQLYCSITNQREFNPDASWIVINGPDGEFGFGISFKQECTACGICAAHCAFGALELGQQG